MLKYSLAIVVAGLFAASLSGQAAAQPTTQARVDVPFSIQYQTVVGQSVYVLGDLPELGANDVRRAVKLEPSSYPVWKATVSLPRGRSYSYRFVVRNDSAAQVSISTNGSTVSGPFNTATPADVTPPPGKLIAYHSGWRAPILNWRQPAVAGTGSFSTETMSAFSRARSSTEYRWVARLDIARTGARTGAPIEFFFSNPATGGRDPASGWYLSSLDAVLVQDGQYYSYIPAATVSPAQRAYSPSNPPVRASISTNLGGTRAYRVFLPRGYAQHTNKRYPVLYMHDGQNVFEQGAFGSWNAGITIPSLQAGTHPVGQMREIIVVAIDNGPNRLNEYAAPASGSPGIGDRYTRFIRDELKPFIDATYRTIPTPDVTGVAGSSMGGQISMYQGWDFGSTFTRIGAFSGAWNVAGSVGSVPVFNTIFYDRVRNEPITGARLGLRVYLDSGDSGTAEDNFGLTMSLRDNLIARSTAAYVLERQVEHVVGFNQQHNEAAWAQRLPAALAYLYPATEEPNAALMALWAVPIKQSTQVSPAGAFEGR